MIAKRCGGRWHEACVICRLHSLGVDMTGDQLVVAVFGAGMAQSLLGAKTLHAWHALCPSTHRQTLATHVLAGWRHVAWPVGRATPGPIVVLKGNLHAQIVGYRAACPASGRAGGYAKNRHPGCEENGLRNLFDSSQEVTGKGFFRDRRQS